jgi:hypothetical protein
MTGLPIRDSSGRCRSLPGTRRRRIAFHPNGRSAAMGRRHRTLVGLHLRVIQRSRLEAALAVRAVAGRGLDRHAPTFDAPIGMPAKWKRLLELEVPHRAFVVPVALTLDPV